MIIKILVLLEFSIKIAWGKSNKKLANRYMICQGLTAIARKKVTFSVNSYKIEQNI